MTPIQELMHNQITRALLRREQAKSRTASKKQAAINLKTVELRRAAEDRQLAREYNCTVSDFA